MTIDTSSIKHVRILADLVERGDTVIDPATQEPGIVARIHRARRRLVLGLTIELVDGRTIEIGAAKFLQQPTRAA